MTITSWDEIVPGRQFINWLWRNKEKLGIERVFPDVGHDGGVMAMLALENLVRDFRRELKNQPIDMRLSGGGICALIRDECQHQYTECERCPEYTKYHKKERTHEPEFIGAALNEGDGVYKP
jgi:hypothetical protein